MTASSAAFRGHGIYRRRDTWYKRWGIKALEALDLSENLYRASLGLKEVPNGWISLIMLPIAIIVTIGFASLALLFDVMPTWEATNTIRTNAETMFQGMALAGLLGWLAQWAPLSLTFLPTGTELLGSKLAQFDIPLLQIAVWMFVGFDMATDLGHVNHEMRVHWVSFVGLPYEQGFGDGVLVSIWNFLLAGPKVWVGAALYHLVFLGVLLSASYGLELITILLGWTTVALVWKSFGYWILGWWNGSSGRARFNRGGGIDTGYDPGARRQDRQAWSQESGGDDFSFGHYAAEDNLGGGSAHYDEPANDAFDAAMHGGSGVDDIKERLRRARAARR